MRVKWHQYLQLRSEADRENYPAATSQQAVCGWHPSDCTSKDSVARSSRLIPGIWQARIEIQFYLHFNFQSISVSRHLQYRCSQDRNLAGGNIVYQRCIHLRDWCGVKLLEGDRHCVLNVVSQLPLRRVASWQPIRSSHTCRSSACIQQIENPSYWKARFIASYSTL